LKRNTTVNVTATTANISAVPVKADIVLYHSSTVSFDDNYLLLFKNSLASGLSEANLNVPWKIKTTKLTTGKVNHGSPHRNKYTYIHIEIKIKVGMEVHMCD
jgi:hypothetical protein